MKKIEKREEALARLLRVACSLLPDDLSELGDEDAKLAEKVTGEALWWLEFAPRGCKPVATDPKRRTGYKLAREWAGYTLGAGMQLVPPPQKKRRTRRPLRVLQGGSQ